MKSTRKTSYFTAILSVAFVLFLLASLTFFIFKTNQLLANLKENIEISVFLQDFASDVDIANLADDIANAPYTKEANYVSKADAMEQFANEFEVELLKENPLPASIQLKVNANYANTDSLNVVTQKIKQNNIVSDIHYQQDIVELLSTNVKKIGIALGSAAILFTIIAFTLIDSTIRLSVFSKRFLIKSMQLVGAKNSFIILPFIRKSIINGFISSLIALLLLLVVAYGLNKQFGFIQLQQNQQFYLILVLSLFVFGILLSILATWLSVRKYLKANIEDLY